MNKPLRLAILTVDGETVKIDICRKLYALFFVWRLFFVANEKNLVPFTSEQSHEAAVKNGRKGGIASGEAKRNRKMLRDCIDYLLEREDAMVLGADGNPMSGAEQLAYNLFVKALVETDAAKAAKAFEVLRDTAGQRPVEKVQATQTVVDMSKFSTEEIKAMLDDDIS